MTHQHQYPLPTKGRGFRKVLKTTFLTGLFLIALPFSLAISQPPTPVENPAQATFDRGMQHYQNGTADALKIAVQQWQTALSQSRQAGDRSREILVLNWLGIAYTDLGEFNQALDIYHQLLPLVRSLNDHHTEASTLMSMAKVQAFLGEYQKSLDFYSRALPLWQAVGFRSGTAAVLNNMGKVYADLGESALSLNYYNQVLPLVREAGSVEGEAAVLNNIGRIHAEQDNFEQALTNYRQALPLWQKLGNVRGEASTLNNIGIASTQLALSQKQPLTPAINLFDQALTLWQKIGDRRGEASTLSNLGFVYANSGNLNKALEYYSQSLSQRRQIQDAVGVALTLYRSAVTERERGNFQTALTQIEEALNLVEGLRTKVNNSDLRATFFASKQEYYEFYIDLLMQLHQRNPQQGLDAKALQASERARARSLLDILAQGGDAIQSGIPAELLAKKRQLQWQLEATEKRRLDLWQNNHRPEKITALNQEIDQLLQQYQALETQLKTISPRYTGLTQPQPLTVPEIQQQVLDKDSLLLSYFLGEERSYLWVVSSNSLKSYELPGREKIQNTAQAFREVLVNPRTRFSLSRIAAVAQSSSEVILKPIAPLLTQKRLLIVSDGALQYIPFSALAVPNQAEYTPLIVNHEIVTLPSASTLGILRQELKGRPAASKAVAVLADPVFAANDERLQPAVRRPKTPLPSDLQRSAEESGVDLARLPFSEAEAKQIVALVPGPETKQAVAFAANLKAATSPELEDYRIVHFATHGLLNSETPELSGLVLSLVDETGQPQEGFLRLPDIFNLNLRADLVVLSACQTGLGKQIRGEGLVGLTRGFMYAGAARVVVSLWNVDDQATSELMVSFYQKMLRDGLEPVAALRAAQVAMWQQERSATPFFWAAFTLQGEWR